MSRTLLSIAGAALVAFSAGATAQAAIVYPISATGSSSYSGYPDADAIDQDAGYLQSDWSSNGGGASAFLNLDLGGVYTLDQAYVTDRVTSGGGNGCLCLGTTDFTTRFSLQAFADAGFTTALGSALVFNHATPVGPTQTSDFQTVVSLGGLSGRYLQYRVLAANGPNTGLSDIHFSTSNGGAVPEPGAWALMILGFAGMGATLRRRRAVAAA